MTNNNASLIKLGAFGLAIFVLWRVSKPFRDGLDAAKQSLDSASQSAGEALSDIDDYLTGRGSAQLTSAYFFLFEKYVDSDFFVNKSWRKSMSDAHPDNAVLFRKILTLKGQIKPEYRHLIEKMVTLQTINEATPWMLTGQP